MKLISSDKSELMNVSARERDGGDLVIKNRDFGTTPMTAPHAPRSQGGVQVTREQSIVD